MLISTINNKYFLPMLITGFVLIVLFNIISSLIGAAQVESISFSDNPYSYIQEKSNTYEGK